MTGILPIKKYGEHSAVNIFRESSMIDPGQYDSDFGFTDSEVMDLCELPSGKGFADVVYFPKKNTKKPALLVELKWKKTAKGAIAQIKDKGYASWLESYTGDILLVGINYDEKKGHTCVIEKQETSTATREVSRKEHAGHGNQGTAGRRS